MNILFLTREYKHPLLNKCGGTGVFYSNLAPELVKKGHNVFVLGVHNNHLEFDDNGVQVTFIKSLFKRNIFFNLMRSVTGKIKLLEKLHFKIHEYEKKDVASQLYQFIKKQNLSIDIIETHDFDGLSLYLNDAIPYTVRCHGSYSVLANYFGYKTEKGRIHCERKAFLKVENSIVISAFSKKINTELFKLKSPSLIYNGINTTFFKPNSKVQIIPNSIFYFGNISTEKGADIAIDSFVEIARKNTDATLHFIGKLGKYNLEIVEKLKQFGIENKVFFYGLLSPIEVIETLNKAEVVIFPSRGETFGLDLWEKMRL